MARSNRAGEKSHREASLHSRTFSAKVAGADKRPLTALRLSIHQRQADLGHEFAKLPVLVHRLKLAVGDERGELQVVPLVSDIEVLQGIVLLDQGCVGTGHFKS